jgi:hypothetical protein
MIIKRTTIVITILLTRRQSKDKVCGTEPVNLLCARIPNYAQPVPTRYVPNNPQRTESQISRHPFFLARNHSGSHYNFARVFQQVIVAKKQTISFSYFQVGTEYDNENLF